MKQEGRNTFGVGKGRLYLFLLEYVLIILSFPYGYLSDGSLLRVSVCVCVTKEKRYYTNITNSTTMRQL